MRARDVLQVLAVACVLAAAGLMDRTVLLRTDVQPDYEPWATNFVEARGWPVAWLVTDERVPVARRVLKVRGVISILFFVPFAAAGVWVWRTAPRRRIGQAKRAG